MSNKWKPLLQSPSLERAYVLASYNESETELFLRIRKQLAMQFGKIDYETQTKAIISWNADYGSHHSLVRIISFEHLVKREQLVQLRQSTLLLEKQHQTQSLPLIQLDPGYVTQFTVVHTTLTEDFHRIYLYGGIYAETLLYFEKLSFRPFSHAPKHFHHKEMITAFNDIRTIGLPN